MNRAPILVASVVACLVASPVFAAPQGARDVFSDAIARNLEKAGSNRAEIERFLDRAEKSGDAQKRDAARWLVANMDGHGLRSSS